MNARELAKAVIGRIIALDPRFAEVTSATLDAWAAVLDGVAWPDEALAAVVQHYRRPNAFQIMPGDIVDYCKRQPPWSSREHATDFVRQMRQHPHTPLIEHYSGMRPPEPSEFEAWIDAHEQEIVTMIVVMKSRPPVS